MRQPDRHLCETLVIVSVTVFSECVCLVSVRIFSYPEISMECLVHNRSGLTGPRNSSAPLWITSFLLSSEHEQQVILIFPEKNVLW